MRLVARALAGGDHLEAAGARPVDMLADERRLIAPGEAVDDAGVLRLAREQRAGKDIGLHIDHDDVLAVRDGLERVSDAGLGNAGCLNDDLDAGKRNERLGVGGDVQAPSLQCVAERRRGECFGGPAGARQLAARASDIEVGDADHMHALRAPRLREEHGAELAGADQADRHRPAGRCALQQLRVQVHCSLSSGGVDASERPTAMSRTLITHTVHSRQLALALPMRQHPDAGGSWRRRNGPMVG